VVLATDSATPCEYEHLPLANLLYSPVDSALAVDPKGDMTLLITTCNYLYDKRLSLMHHDYGCGLTSFLLKYLAVGAQHIVCKRQTENLH
jgi:hypothetical protein